MKMKVSILFSLCACILMLVSNDPGAIAADDVYCAIYAKKAVAQSKENASKGCGGKGPGWSLDFNLHKSWCANVTDDVAELENKKRVIYLANCPKTKWRPLNDSLATQYALTAVAQYNQSKGCNFSGPAWSSDFAYHYTWAMKQSSSALNAGTLFRQQALKQCKNITYPSSIGSESKPQGLNIAGLYEEVGWRYVPEARIQNTRYRIEQTGNEFTMGYLGGPLAAQGQIFGKKLRIY